MIPKTIHISHNDHNQLKFTKYNWKRLNPNYHIELYDNRRSETFLSTEYSDYHKKVFAFIKDEPIKADFWKACLLYKKGGVCVDPNIEPLVPINTFLDPNIDFFTCFPILKHKSNPRIIMSKPNDNFMKKAIDVYLENYRIYQQFSSSVSRRKYSYIPSKVIYSYNNWSMLNILTDLGIFKYNHPEIYVNNIYRVKLVGENYHYSFTSPNH